MFSLNHAAGSCRLGNTSALALEQPPVPESLVQPASVDKPEGMRVTDASETLQK